MSVLCMDSDINHIHIILKDENGEELGYFNELPWSANLVLMETPPQGFAPLEV